MTQQRSAGSFLAVSLLATPGVGAIFRILCSSAQHGRSYHVSPRSQQLKRQTPTCGVCVTEANQELCRAMNPIPSLTTARSGSVTERGASLLYPRGGSRDFGLNSETRTIRKSRALSVSRIYWAEGTACA